MNKTETKQKPVKVDRTISDLYKSKRKESRFKYSFAKR